jgi:nucleotide-binding universal stress UspA family protein
MTLDFITVPVDGSPFSGTAVPIAVAVGRAAGATVGLVAIAAEQADVASVTAQVAEATAGLPGPTTAGDVIVDPDPVGALLGIADRAGTVLCVASHDHLPGAAAILNSVGSLLIERARHPMLVVGPEADVAELGGDVVVAVDGRQSPETLLATASRWAGWLDAPLRVVTVYEPVLPDLRNPDHFSRSHGPSSDPVEYLRRVTHGLDDGGRRRVELVAIPDPVSVAEGLSQHLAARPALVAVVGAHGGTHREHHLIAGVVRHLLRQVHLPLLVVPGPPRVRRWEQDAEAAGVYVG